MRVLHLIPSISPLRGGPSQAVLSMVAALRQQGMDASILTTNDHGPGVQTTMPLGRWHEQQALGQAVPVLAFGRWSPPQRAVREFAMAPGFNRWLGRHARDYQLVHVHALFSCTTSLAMAQLRCQGVPYLLRTIGQLNTWSLGQSAGRKQLFLKLVDRANLEGAAALHFTSEAERQEAAALGLSTPSFVLPLGVEPQASRAERSSSVAVTFLFLSRLHPKKQLEVLLEALALLRANCPTASWRLQVAGHGEPEYVLQLQAMAQRLGIADRCHWLGFVTGAPKQELLASADWFVLPSASENFGIAAAEALAAGTPVILSPGVAVAEAVQRAGAGLVVEATLEPLAAALKRALEPPATAMVSAARNVAANVYGWGAIATELDTCYQGIARASLAPKGTQPSASPKGRQGI